jgi:hypothetical protein
LATRRDKFGVVSDFDNAAAGHHHTRSAVAAWESRCAITMAVRPGMGTTPLREALSQLAAEGGPAAILKCQTLAR